MKTFSIARRLVLGPVIVILSFSLHNRVMMFIQALAGVVYFSLGLFELHERKSSKERYLDQRRRLREVVKKI